MDVVDLMGGLSKLIDEHEMGVLKGQRGMPKLTAGEQTATLSPDEVKLARAEAKELWDAIHAKDEAGGVKADIDARGLQGELDRKVDIVKSRWGVRDITGETGFIDDNPKFMLPRYQKPPAPPKPGTGAGGGPVPKGGLGAGGVGRGASVVEGGAAVVAGIVYGPEAVYCAYFPRLCTRPSVVMSRSRGGASRSSSRCWPVAMPT